MASPIVLLRDARWLTPSRARAYFLVWLLLQIALAAAFATQFQRAAEAAGGKPVAADFMTFWSAARMGVLSGPNAAYNDAARTALQHAAGALGPGGHYAYWYPPPFLLLTLPLGLVGYIPAICAFLAGGYALLIATLRRILPSPWGVTALILSPVMMLNTVIGQNGAYTATCFGAAMLLLERTPAAAGACLGLLVVKPHLAVLIPIALAAARRWRAFVSCGATAVLLCALSWATLGTGVWQAFLTHSREATATLENFAEDWPKIQSVFSAVRLLHGSIPLAYTLQALCAAAAAITVALIARRRPGAGPEIATLVTAALLTTPYVFDYDLTCLLVPMAYIGACATRGVWLPWEKILLLLLFVLPAGIRAVAMNYGVPIIPLALATLLAVCARRAKRENASF
jgi:hypothetical protein